MRTWSARSSATHQWRRRRQLHLCLVCNTPINGGAGNDRLNGVDGNDLIRGGTGNDTLISA
jgi:hypothetical protein